MVCMQVCMYMMEYNWIRCSRGERSKPTACTHIFYSMQVLHYHQQHKALLPWRPPHPLSPPKPQQLMEEVGQDTMPSMLAAKQDYYKTGSWTFLESAWFIILINTNVSLILGMCRICRHNFQIIGHFRHWAYLGNNWVKFWESRNCQNAAVILVVPREAKSIFLCGCCLL